MYARVYLCMPVYIYWLQCVFSYSQNNIQWIFEKKLLAFFLLPDIYSRNKRAFIYLYLCRYNLKLQAINLILQ